MIVTSSKMISLEVFQATKIMKAPKINSWKTKNKKVLKRVHQIFLKKHNLNLFNPKINSSLLQCLWRIMQLKNKEVSIRLNRVQLIRNYKIKINRKTLTRTTRRTRRTTKWTRTISSPRPRSYSRTSQSPQWKTSWKTLPPITTCSMGDSTRTQRDSGVSCTRPSPRRHSTRTYWTSHHRTCSLGQRITRQGR